MAGKFLVLDEAAQRLGISVEEFQRLVDRKKFFPLRDGTTLKFKLEDLDRYAAEADASGEQSGLTIELDMGAPAGAELALADSVAGPAAGEPAPAASDSLTIDLAGSGPLAAASGPGSGGPPTPPPGNDDLAATMLGTSGEAIGLDSLDLDLEAVVGLSSPSVAAGSPKSAASPPRQPAVADDSGTLAIDLSDIGVGAPGQGSGDLVVGSGAEASGAGTNAGAALSDVLDSGLSLEDGDAIASGIDLGPLDGSGLDNDGGTMLAGDAFELGTPGDDDESASVVMAEESSVGESSFFGSGMDGESSEFTDESGLGGSLMAEAAEVPAMSLDTGDWGEGRVVPDVGFSVWQVSGLVCLSLLLLTGGFLMFDVIQTVGSRDDLGLAGPLVSPLARLFGWRQ